MSPARSAVSQKVVAALPSLLLVAASYAFRLPALLNARATNSDAAVVGLQAMHLLRGEFAPFLWGSGYQTSADSFVCAAFFLVFGPSALALMLSSLSLHVLATWLVFATLRRHFPDWTAVLLTLPLVVSPSSVHSYALYPPRQASLTLALAAFFALDAATPARRHVKSHAPHAATTDCAWVFAGGLCSTLAVSADPYPLVLLPAIALFAGLGLVHAANKLPRVVAFGVGALAGAVPFFILRHHEGAKSGPLTLSFATVSHNAELLVTECLPWALSYKTYFARHAMDYAPWDAPLAFRVVGVVGALALLGLVVTAFVAAFMRRVPWPIRRLGVAGAFAFPIAIAGFLLSVMVMDHFSMRYLAVLTLMIPFAVAPAARLFGPRRFALAIAPHLVASAIAGWVGYGPFVRGLVPVETGEWADDFAVLDMMRERDLVYAEADYWTAYRMTFLAREAAVVVPIHEQTDRYAPYRAGFLRAPRYAYIFDPYRSREDVSAFARDLRRTSASVEETSIGRLRVFIATRSH